jgi:hypothetical protein
VGGAARGIGAVEPQRRERSSVARYAKGVALGVDELQPGGRRGERRDALEAQVQEELVGEAQPSLDGVRLVRDQVRADGGRPGPTESSGVARVHTMFPSRTRATVRSRIRARNRCVATQ